MCCTVLCNNWYRTTSPFFTSISHPNKWKRKVVSLLENPKAYLNEGDNLCCQDRKRREKRSVNYTLFQIPIQSSLNDDDNGSLMNEIQWMKLFMIEWRETFQDEGGDAMNVNKLIIVIESSSTTSGVVRAVNSCVIVVVKKFHGENFFPRIHYGREWRRRESVSPSICVSFSSWKDETWHWSWRTKESGKECTRVLVNDLSVSESVRMNTREESVHSRLLNVAMYVHIDFSCWKEQKILQQNKKNTWTWIAFSIVKVDWKCEIVTESQEGWVSGPFNAHWVS